MLRHSLRAAALLAWALLCLAVPAQARAPTNEVLQAAFEARLGAALAEAGLDGDQVGLLLYSPRENAYLYRQNMHTPLVAASNVKLITTYAALRVLTPDYRWRTRFYLVREHDDPQGSPGQAPRLGLLVQATGDPTLSGADLDRVAWLLRSHGVNRLEAGLFFDGSRFDGVRFPSAWGDVSRGQPWFAPVSAFIVDRNVIDFHIATRPGGLGFDVFTPTPGFQVISALEPADVEQPAIRVAQHWQGDSATFTVLGNLAPATEPYRISAAIERPRVHFYRRLRAGLERAGVSGAMPLRDETAPERRTLLHTVLSPPLREVLQEVNKHSSNLAAEVLLRTMGLYEKEAHVSSADGLAVLQRVLSREFPEVPAELHLVDGSGLSRENRVSPLLLVRLLNRVRGEFGIHPEFINSLSVALTDGTLQYRDFPWRLRGRLRAKSGTLTGVSNLSGYVQLESDVVVFAFLINDAQRSYLELQAAQDKIVSELYDALIAREAGDLAALQRTPPATARTRSTAAAPAAASSAARPTPAATAQAAAPAAPSTVAPAVAPAATPGATPSAVPASAPPGTASPPSVPAAPAKPPVAAEQRALPSHAEAEAAGGLSRGRTTAAPRVLTPPPSSPKTK